MLSKPRRTTGRWVVAVSLVFGGALALPLEAGPAGVFADRARETGLVFEHFNGMSGEFYFPEMTGQGGALFDYDDDGDLDVFLAQGAMLGPDKTLDEALFPPPSGRPGGDRLFRNDRLADGSIRFTDVTESSEFLGRGYGMGAATADVDGDGDVDLLVTRYGPNQLWINRGDGTFEDGSEAAGLLHSSWSTSATFADLDGDRLP